MKMREARHGIQENHINIGKCMKKGVQESLSREREGLAFSMHGKRSRNLKNQ